MASEKVDAYIAALDEPKRATLTELRRRIMAEIPAAEEGIAYGAPVFKIGGTAVAGFSAAKHHLSYLPHSGTVLAMLTADQLGGLHATKGALHMPVDRPLPVDLIRALIALRRAEADV